MTTYEACATPQIMASGTRLAPSPDRAHIGRVRRSRYERGLRRGIVGAVITTALAAVPAQAGVPPTAHAADRDCADFSTQAEAQRYFIEQGGPESDPDRLDGTDNDGRACESLPCPCSYSTGGGGESKPKPKPQRRKAKRTKVIPARIVSVTDGDTVKVRYGKTRRTIRIIGIDTPETKRPGVGVECGGPQASANMGRLAPEGARVTLRTDPTQDTIDRYGRLLAYVGRKRRDLGRSQIAAGWAKTYVYGGKPFQRTAAYRRSEAKAKRLGKGVHGMCGGDFHSEQPGAAALPVAPTNARRCGSFRVTGLLTAIRVRVTRGRVGCGRARQVMKSLFRRKRSRVLGWRCVGPQTGYAACRKRGNRVVAEF